MGGILYGRNPLGGILCGRNPVWEESRVGGIPCGRNPMWEESCVGGIPLEGIPWEESMGRNTMTTGMLIYPLVKNSMQLSDR